MNGEKMSTFVFFTDLHFFVQKTEKRFSKCLLSVADPTAVTKMKIKSVNLIERTVGVEKVF